MKILYLIFALTPFLGKAQITGYVWKDINQNGRFDAHETATSCVKIHAYSKDGPLLNHVNLTKDGFYHISLPPGEKVRIEYSILKNNSYLNTDSRLVRFVTSPAEVNVTLNTLRQQADTHTRWAESIYANGNYTEELSNTLVSLSITTSRNFSENIKELITPYKTGSLWGLAYEQNTERLYAGAIAKRHSAFGPLGAGGIYVASPDSGIIHPFISLDQIGIQTAPAKLPRDLSGGLTSVSHDSLMFSLVGKCSLGGLDVSDDGQTLWVMNLYDRKLYQINLPADGSTPKASDVYGYPVPGIEEKQKGGEVRPFAVKYYNDKVYIGVVHDASHSQQATDLKAIVYALDPAKPGESTFTEVFSMKLDYPRGALDYGVSGWFPWADDYNQAIVKVAGNWMIYPQPILADIEFDNDGSMILGFMDRLGHQTGDGQLFRPKGSPQLQTYRGLAGGDVLRVARVGDHYELERNARAGDQRTGGRNNRQGPVGGEFYYNDDFKANGVVWHQETATGGLALNPATGELLVAAREPEPGQYLTGGVKYFNNRTGEFIRGQSVFPAGGQPGYFWKTNNVGDIELITEAPPIVIGDRVWHDTDEDGIQDADEPGLARVQVQLFQGDQLLAKTQTDEEGYYSFGGTKQSAKLKPNTAYEIRIPFRQYTYAGLYLPKPLAQRPVVETDMPTEIDNDAVPDGDAAVIRLKTRRAGDIMQGLDAGLRLPGEVTNKTTDRLTLTPNPTSGNVEVYYRSHQPTGIVTLLVTDVRGRSLMIRTEQLNQDVFRKTIDLSLYVSGTYFVTISEDSQSITRSLIKN